MKKLFLLLVLLAFAGTGQATELGVNETTIEAHNESAEDSAAQYTGIDSLKASCELEGLACDPVSDTSVDTCRTLEWSTDQGPVRIQGCEKQDAVEVYRKEYPRTASFSACLGAQGCVDEMTGWVSFTPTSDDVSLSDSGDTTDESVEEVTDGTTYDAAPEEQTSDLTSEFTWDSEPAELAGKYKTLMQAWQDEEIERLTVDGQQLIVVPWFVDEAGTYHTSCGAAGTSNDYCVVTDEDSQYTFAVSMSRDERLVNEQAQALFNKVKHVSTSEYGRTARWQFRVRDGDVVLGTDDFASDADARYLLALWNFVHNPVLNDQGLKDEMRAYAQGYCADYKQHAFVADEQEGIRYWPAGGGNVGKVPSLAASSDWWGVTYPGYYGDMSLAMLACGANTQDQEYFEVADDALKAYFAIADYDGSSLRLAHGRSGVWTVSGTGDVGYVCQDGCPSHGGTEDADGVRFTSICTVDRYADALGLGFTPLADRFCEDVVSSSGFEPTAYSVQWTGDGHPASGLDAGWQANGLALYIDVGETAWAADRFESVWNKQWTGESFNNAQLFDTFWGGFLVNGLGLNLGRADAAFLAGGITPADPGTSVPDDEPIDEPVVGQPGEDNQPDGSQEDSAGDAPVQEPVEEQPVDDGQPDGSGDDSAPGDVAAQPLIASLEPSCSVNGEACEVSSDLYDGGACRELVFSAPGGELILKGCHKNEDTVELYLLKAPVSSTYEVCLSEGCVSELSWFARFSPDTPVQERPAPQPARDPSQDPVMQLSTSVTPAGSLVADVLEQTGCRLIEHNMPSGDLDVRICPKGGGVYELYRLSQRRDAQLCVGGACVGHNSGFARLG